MARIARESNNSWWRNVNGRAVVSEKRSPAGSQTVGCVELEKGYGSWQPIYRKLLWRRHWVNLAVDWKRFGFGLNLDFDHGFTFDLQILCLNFYYIYSRRYYGR